MNNKAENPQPKELSPQERKNIIKEILLEEQSELLDQPSYEALERLIANTIEQTAYGLAQSLSDEDILGMIRQHPGSFDYLLRDVDDQYILDMIGKVKILWVVPSEILMQ